MNELKLDDNNDIVISNYDIELVDSKLQIAQHVRSRLLLYFGEWFLNKNIGVPYFEHMFIKPVNLGNVESILKTVILNTPGVLKLTFFSTEYNSTNRKLKVTFTAETKLGLINNISVIIND